jgi:hypothetical protein
MLPTAKKNCYRRNNFFKIQVERCSASKNLLHTSGSGSDIKFFYKNFLLPLVLCYGKKVPRKLYTTVIICTVEIMALSSDEITSIALGEDNSYCICTSTGTYWSNIPKGLCNSCATERKVYITF